MELKFGQANSYYLSFSLYNQADVLQGRGDLDGAMKLWKEVEQICRQSANLKEFSTSPVKISNEGLKDLSIILAKCLTNQGAFLAMRGNLDEAMVRLKEAEQIFRRLDMKDDSVKTCLENQATIKSNQGNILYARGDLNGAMALHKEAEQIFRQMDMKDDRVKTCLKNQAMIQGDQGNILYARGDLNGAMALHKEAEQIFRQLGELQGLGFNILAQARIHCDQGNLDRALALNSDMESIGRQSGNSLGVSSSLANQAFILEKMGRAKEALPLAEEAYRLAKPHGSSSLEQIQMLLDSLRQPAQSKYSGRRLEHPSTVNPAKNLEPARKQKLKILIWAKSVMISAFPFGAGVFISLRWHWGWVAGVPLLISGILVFS